MRRQRKERALGGIIKHSLRPASAVMLVHASGLLVAASALLVTSLLSLSPKHRPFPSLLEVPDLAKPGLGLGGPVSLDPFHSCILPDGCATLSGYETAPVVS